MIEVNLPFSESSLWSNSGASSSLAPKISLLGVSLYEGGRDWGGGRAREEVALGPDNAMYGLTGSTSDGADGEGLGRLLGVAIVTFRLALFQYQHVILH